MKNAIGNKLNVRWIVMVDFISFFSDEYSGPLIDEKNSLFAITPPVNREVEHAQLLSPTSSFICESASRILFQSIDWMKSNSCFQTLE